MRLAPTHVNALPARLLAAAGTAAVIGAGLVASATPATAANCAAIDCTSHYQGGGVQTSPTNWLIRWGSGVPAEEWNTAQRFLTDVDGSGYLSGLPQYSVSSGAKVTTAATFGGTVTLTPATTTSTTLTDNDIVTELRNDIDSGEAGHDLPSASASTNYLIMLPTGATISDPAGNPSTCGYHSSTVEADGVTPIRYAVLPDMATDAAHQTCFGGNVASSPTGNAISGMLSDFLVGMVTDPTSAWHPPLGWSSAAGEIGDTCTPAPSGRLGGLVVHPYWSNASKGCTYGASSIHFPEPPPRWTTATTVTAMFSDTDAYGGSPTFTCAVDSATPKSCRADTWLTWSGFSTGTHTLTVRGTDGSHTLRTGTAKFIVDTTTPSATMNPLPRFVTASSVRLSWVGRDTGTGVASYDVRMRSATVNSGFGSFTNPPDGLGRTSSSLTVTGLVPGTDYCFSVQPTDGAQHVGAWSHEQCVTRMLDDRALARSKGWSAGTSTHQYAGTFLKTTHKGATVAVPAFTGSHVALLVNTCAKCGSVAVYVGSKLLKTVSLVSKTTRASVQVLLPGFSRTSGAVRVVSRSSGIVVIDGLGLSRT